MLVAFLKRLYLFKSLSFCSKAEHPRFAQQVSARCGGKNDNHDNNGNGATGGKRALEKLGFQHCNLCS